MKFEVKMCIKVLFSSVAFLEIQ